MSEIVYFHQTNGSGVPGVGGQGDMVSGASYKPYIYKTSTQHTRLEYFKGILP